MTNAAPLPAIPSSEPRSWLGFACGAGAALIWGVQAVVSRQSVADGLTTADVTFLRFVVASLVLLPFAVWKIRPFPVGQLGWRRAVFLALLAGAPYSLILVGGSAFAPALHGAVISPGLGPVLATALAWLVLGERPGAGRLAGLALIIAGILLFSWQALSGAPVREGAWRGDLLFVLIAMLWSVFALLCKRWRADPLRVTTTIVLLSLPMLPLMAGLMPMRLMQANLGAVALQAAYQGVLVGVVSLVLYTGAVSLIGMARAALFLPLAPVVTALTGAIVLDEWPSGLEVMGMTVVMAGMVLALRPPMRPANGHDLAKTR